MTKTDEQPRFARIANGKHLVFTNETAAELPNFSEAVPFEADGPLMKYRLRVPMERDKSRWPIIKEGDTVEEVQTSLNLLKERVNSQVGKWKVFLGTPAYGGLVGGHQEATKPNEATRGFVQYQHTFIEKSALGQAFNMLWCKALGLAEVGKITHFVMLHSDVVPLGPWISPGVFDHFWLDALIEEFEASGADVLSVVQSFKDGTNLTSTAVQNPHDYYDCRRLSLYEMIDLPGTFRGSDIEGCENSDLLVNTGLFIVDLRNPVWRSHTDGKANFYFTLNDGIEVEEDEHGHQHRRITFEPEDWLFSRQCYQQGLDVAATTKIACQHVAHDGRVYPNYLPDGARDTIPEQLGKRYNLTLDEVYTALRDAAISKQRGQLEEAPAA